MFKRQPRPEQAPESSHPPQKSKDDAGIVRKLILSPRLFEAFMTDHLQNKGKFIRIADLILIAPERIKLGTYNERLYHADILCYARKDQRLKLEIQTAKSAAYKTSEAMNYEGIADAGMFEFQISHERLAISGLTIFGHSSGYGEFPPANRETTIKTIKLMDNPDAVAINHNS